MLIHKRTLGVLNDLPWDGTFVRLGGAIKVPKYRPATIDSLIKLGYIDTKDDWWEIPNNTILAKNILVHYPFFYPILDDNGNLVDINYRDYGENINKNINDLEINKSNIKSKRRKRITIKFN